jgi:hypothetical protein
MVRVGCCGWPKAHDPSSPTYRKADLDIPDEKSDRYGTFRPTDDVFDA